MWREHCSYPAPERSHSSGSLFIPTTTASGATAVHNRLPTPTRSLSLDSTLPCARPSLSRRGSTSSRLSSNGTIIEPNGRSIVIKRVVLDKLKLSIKDAFTPTRDWSSPAYPSQPDAHAFLSFLGVSNRLSRFLEHYMSRHLPATPFASSFQSCRRRPLSRPVAFEVVSTPDASPVTSPVSVAPSYWIRVRALVPGSMILRDDTRQIQNRIEPVPALPALFGPGQSLPINLDGDVWHFEKLGPELDQSFWHLDLASGHERCIIKVVFDQAFGLVGSSI